MQKVGDLILGALNYRVEDVGSNYEGSEDIITKLGMEFDSTPPDFGNIERDPFLERFSLLSADIPKLDNLTQAVCGESFNLHSGAIAIILDQAITYRYFYQTDQWYLIKDDSVESWHLYQEQHWATIVGSITSIEDAQGNPLPSIPEGVTITMNFKQLLVEDEPVTVFSKLVTDIKYDRELQAWHFSVNLTREECKKIKHLDLKLCFQVMIEDDSEPPTLSFSQCSFIWKQDPDKPF